jgi:hypothetical protein
MQENAHSDTRSHLDRFFLGLAISRGGSLGVFSGASVKIVLLCGRWKSLFASLPPSQLGVIK